MSVEKNNRSDGEEEKIMIKGTEIERVKEFSYLGSVITEDGNNRPVIMNALQKGRQTLARLRPVLQSRSIKMRTKEKIIDCMLMPVLHYGLKTLVIRKTDHDKLMALVNSARRITLGYNDRKECKVEELKNEMRIENVGTRVQIKRMRLWKRMQGRNGLAKKIVESKVEAKNKERKPAHTKSWLRQIERDMKDLNISNVEAWNSRKLAYDPDYRPRLLGERERNLKCPNDHCERKFAAVNEMNRHVRNDHNDGKKETGETKGEAKNQMELIEKFRCPNSDCNKEYKTKGWLLRHERVPPIT
ncbi:unnamed protein product [Calicophoron daubneyi]|uniref:C2H2-type domain-containing protein n=1 Tax=Calicophoron daubneyi TaxID=300641 RepID=A0AAV2T9Y7_CALDB